MKKPPNFKITENILMSAESVFAEFGYDGSSLRKITLLAEVNLAAVNYHFNDKETLFRTILKRRLGPINAMRLAELKQAIQIAGTEPVPLPKLFEILARPVFYLGHDQSTGENNVARIIGRCLVEPTPFIQDIIDAEFQPVMTPFAQAVRRHVPTLSPEDFLWRFSFVMGAMHHALATLHCMKSLTHGICRNHDTEGALRRFVEFASANFASPPNLLQGSGPGENN